MELLGQEQIQDEFNAQAISFRARMKTAGCDVILQSVSRMMAGLKEAGLDVSLNMIEYPSTLAFALFGSANNNIVPVTGVLRIGNHEKLFAISTKYDSGACLKIGVSKFDIRYQGPRAVISNSSAATVTNWTAKISADLKADVYDLWNDPAALIKLQKDIIHLAARSRFIQENDVCDAFENGGGMQKTNLKSL